MIIEALPENHEAMRKLAALMFAYLDIASDGGYGVGDLSAAVAMLLGRLLASMDAVHGSEMATIIRDVALRHSARTRAQFEFCDAPVAGNG